MFGDKMNINKVLEQIKNNVDGVTLDFNGNKPELKGFMVSVTDNKINESDFNNVQKITDVLNKLQETAKLLNNINIFIGSWYDNLTKAFYIDLSLNINDLNQAIETAKSFNQKAIFNISDFETIDLRN